MVHGSIDTLASFLSVLLTSFTLLSSERCAMWATVVAFFTEEPVARYAEVSAELTPLGDDDVDISIFLVADIPVVSILLINLTEADDATIFSLTVCVIFLVCVIVMNFVSNLKRRIKGMIMSSAQYVTSIH